MNDLNTGTDDTEGSGHLVGVIVGTVIGIVVGVLFGLPLLK